MSNKDKSDHTGQMFRLISHPCAQIQHCLLCFLNVVVLLFFFAFFYVVTLFVCIDVDVAMCDPVHDVEALHCLCQLLTASGYLF